MREIRDIGANFLVKREMWYFSEIFGERLVRATYLSRLLHYHPVIRLILFASTEVKLERDVRKQELNQSLQPILLAAPLAYGEGHSRRTGAIACA